MDPNDNPMTEPRRNDGAWYLDMLGLRFSDGETSDNGETGRSVPIVFELEGDGSSSSTPTPLEPPTREQGTVSSAAEEEPDLADWQPNELAKQVTKRRNFRWSVVVAAALVVISVVGVWLWLPTTVAAEADEEAAEYQAAIAALRDLLPTAQQTLATVTDPAAGSIELIPLSAQLTRIDAAATEVLSQASRPFPETLPLAPRGALEDLQPTRDTMRLLGDAGSEIVSRMSTTITYRTSLDGIFVLPSLPVRADPVQIDRIGVELAEAVATSAAIHSGLPLDPAFDTHRAAVGQALEQFQAAQSSYLLALRNGNEDAARSGVARLTAFRTDVFLDLIPALATARSEVDRAILELNEDANAAIVAIPR